MPFYGEKEEREYMLAFKRKVKLMCMCRFCSLRENGSKARRTGMALTAKGHATGMKTLIKGYTASSTLSLYLGACSQEISFTHQDQGLWTREETTYFVWEPANDLMGTETKRFSASLRLPRPVYLAEASCVERPKDKIDESRNS